MLTPYEEFRPLRRATRAPPWTCHPLKRVDLNFRPYGRLCEAKGGTWSLGLTGVTSIQPVNGRGIVSPCARQDSRHPLSLSHTVKAR